MKFSSAARGRCSRSVPSNVDFLGHFNLATTLNESVER